jgi:hypothetical protein
MSILVTALAVAAGVVAGRLIMRGVQGRGEGKNVKRDAKSADDAPRAADAAPKGPPRDPFEGFVCRLGDVVIRAGGDEAWLAGALVLAEDAPVAILFVAPEAGGDRAVLARGRGDAMLAWLSPLAKGDVVMGAEPPSAIELGTTRFDRVRRLPLRVERVGTGAPDVGDHVIFAEYAASDGDRLVVLVGAGEPRAWRGSALEEGMYDVLPGGKSTL